MKRKINLLLKRQNGSLTIEASFIIIIFVFGFMAVLSLCKVAKSQIVLQHAINQVAREISGYSYVAGKLGLNKDVTEKDSFISDTDNLISEAINTLNVIKTESTNINDAAQELNLEDLNNIEDVLGKFKKYEDSIGSIKNSYGNIETSTGSIIEAMKTYFSDPKAVLKGFLMLAKSELTDFVVSRFIAAPMSGALVSKYIDEDKLTADIILKRLNIEDGLDGLNFNLSTIFADGKTINITLIYKVRIKLPLVIDKELTCKLNASTLGLGVNGKGNTNAQPSDTSTENNMINIWDYGGEKTTNEFMKIIKAERNLKSVRLPVSLDFYDFDTSTLTYVHSMNTEKKSYTENESLKLNSIKSKIKYYCNDAINDIERIDKITMDDSTEIEFNRSYNCKVIIVMQESAQKQNDELLKIVEEIKKELGQDNLEIELYYSDGLIEADESGE